jgi:hypothetical protein
MKAVCVLMLMTIASVFAAPHKTYRVYNACTKSVKVGYTVRDFGIFFCDKPIVTVMPGKFVDIPYGNDYFPFFFAHGQTKALNLKTGKCDVIGNETMKDLSSIGEIDATCKASSFYSEKYHQMTNSMKLCWCK